MGAGKGAAICRGHGGDAGGDRGFFARGMGENEQLTFPPFVRPFGASEFGPTGRAVVGAGAPSFIRRESLQPLTAAAASLSPLRRSLPRSLGEKAKGNGTETLHRRTDGRTDGERPSLSLSLPLSLG